MGQSISPDRNHGRALFIALGAFVMFSCGDAVTITFVGPMFTVLLAGLFLGEKVRPQSWLAIALAFAGVLIVLRPNLLALGPIAALPLIAALTNSATMLGGAGAIAPMVYVQILVATVIGWAIFGNPRMPMTQLGIGVIVGPGLILWRWGRGPAPEPVD